MASANLCFYNLNFLIFYYTWFYFPFYLLLFTKALIFFLVALEVRSTHGTGKAIGEMCNKQMTVEEKQL